MFILINFNYEINIAMILRDHKLIKGLRYIPNFISKQQKQMILTKINSYPWCNELQRKQQYYGIRYFQTKIQNASLQPMESTDHYPLQFFDFLIKRSINLDIFKQSYPPNQVLVNRYGPKDKLGMHVEDKLAFGAIIAGVSLGSKEFLRLSNLYEPKQEYLLQIDDCSCYVLQDQARNNYRHGIGRVVQGKKYKDEHFQRISLTIRHVIETRRKIA